MKTKHSVYLIITVLIMAFLISGCKKKSDDEDQESKEYTETIYSNPEDHQILEVDSAGRKIILMGTKDATGLPLTVTQALVDAADMNPDHRLLMDFNPDGTVSQISNPNLGIMSFTYVNENTTVVRLTLPDTLGSYQMSFDPKNVKSTGNCGCGKKKPPVTGPMRSKTYVPPVNVRSGSQPISNFAANLFKPNSAGSIDAVITATYGNGGSFVKGLTMSATYLTSEGKKGAVQVNPGYTDGVWGYSMPSNPAPPPPSGFKAAAYSLFNKLCYGSIPIGLAKETICGAFAPTGVGFAACEVILTAYVWLCRANTVYKVGSYVVDIYSATEVNITITAQHPTLPAQSKQVKFLPASPSLPDVEFFYEANATFSAVYTEPAAPVALNGYTIVATLSDAGSGTVTVRLSMVGTDGYTQSQDFQVEPGGSCQMGIPGAVQGVRDDIVARINPGQPTLPGQVVKLYIIFQ